MKFSEDVIYPLSEIIEWKVNRLNNIVSQPQAFDGCSFCRYNECVKSGKGKYA